MTKADDIFARLVDWTSIDDLCRDFGQLPHSIRALISVQARKRGIKIERHRIDGITSYRISPKSPAVDAFATAEARP